MSPSSSLSSLPEAEEPRRDVAASLAASDDKVGRDFGPSPARPTSILKHRSYRINQPDNAAYAESSTAHLKRGTARSLLPILSRLKQATPMNGDGSTDSADVRLNASTAPAYPTATGTTNPSLSDDESEGFVVMEDVQDEHASSQAEKTSVLFSEQAGVRTEATEAVDGGEYVEEDEMGDGEGGSPLTVLDDDIGMPLSYYRHTIGEFSEPSAAPTSREDSSDGSDDLTAFMPEDIKTERYARWVATLPGESQVQLVRYNRRKARKAKEEYEIFGTPERPRKDNKTRTTRAVRDSRKAEGRELHAYHSGDSEDFEMDHRPILERTGVKRDIKMFTESIDLLSEHTDDEQRTYQVIDRLGEGTFSSVYLAVDRLHGRFYNEWWTGVPDSDKETRFRSTRHGKKLALKRVLATSSPHRIENELDILEALRGCRNVSQLVTAFRQDDQVIIVLPYHQTDDFRHYYKHMDAKHMRLYMVALLRALADIHSRGIVHRDVKPANFLFDYKSGEGVLCDFGLAERYVPPRTPSCQHEAATLENLGGTRTKTAETVVVEQAVYNARKRSRLAEGKIGFVQEDKRPAIKTNRAGTRGFRAPEILLKCPDQTVAIDVWSAGIILLSFLAEKFPVFNSNDDIEALMEIAAIFGKNAMEKCAMLHNRTFMTNVPTLEQAPPSLSHVILRLNPQLYDPPNARASAEEALEHIEGMDAAIDLCGRLLRLDATKRISAKAALDHKFFQNSEKAEASGTILSGVDGKCGRLHSIKDGKHQAWFYEDCQDMHFGQGIPTAADRLCPEHEHWQQRTLLNPISTSRHFVDDEHSDSPLADTIDERPVFSVRDTNVDLSLRTTHGTIAK